MLDYILRQFSDASDRDLDEFVFTPIIVNDTLQGNYSLRKYREIFKLGCGFS